jgi:uncharacterized protein (DUF1015 family)
MATVIPFRGLTFSSAKVPDLTQVVSPPYDVISPEKDEEYRRRHPNNIVHLILPREENGRNKYKSAASQLKSWRKAGVLSRDDNPGFYVVSQKYTVKGLGERTRFGLVARVRIEDEASKIILPHEKTMAGPRVDRTELLAATETNLSPIFLLYSDPDGKIESLVESVSAQPPERWAVDDNGIEASFWRITDKSTMTTLTRVFKDRTLWIADGHHRYSASRTLRDTLRKKDGSDPATRGYDYIMATLTSMDSAGVTILPYHRALLGQEGLDQTKLVSMAREYFDVKEFAFEGVDQRAEQIRRKLRAAAGEDRNLMAVYMGQGSYLILILRDSIPKEKILPDSVQGPLQNLDVSILHHVLLESVLGISQEDQRKAGGPLKYTADVDRAMSWVDAREAQAALLVNPTMKEQLMAVSNAGLQMPQKSTYFYPKLLTGLVLNPMDPGDEVR